MIEDFNNKGPQKNVQTFIISATSVALTRSLLTEQSQKHPKRKLASLLGKTCLRRNDDFIFVRLQRFANSREFSYDYVLSLQKQTSFRTLVKGDCPRRLSFF